MQTSLDAKPRFSFQTPARAGPDAGIRVTDRVLDSKAKARRVVLKRVNLDTIGVRADFLRSGTMARGAGETGKVEQYLCSRVSRNPMARASCAEYLGEFTAEASEYGFTKGTAPLWLFPATLWCAPPVRSISASSPLRPPSTASPKVWPQTLALMKQRPHTSALVKVWAPCCHGGM